MLNDIDNFFVSRLVKILWIEHKNKFFAYMCTLKKYINLNYEIWNKINKPKCSIHI